MSNQQPLTMSRRRFPDWRRCAGHRPAAGRLYGPKQLAQAISEALPQSCVRRAAFDRSLAFEAIVQDGKMVGVQPVQDDPVSQWLITAAPYQVHAENRHQIPDGACAGWYPAAAPSCARG